MRWKAEQPRALAASCQGCRLRKAGPTLACATRGRPGSKVRWGEGWKQGGGLRAAALPVTAHCGPWDGAQSLQTSAVKTREPVCSTQAEQAWHRQPRSSGCLSQAQPLDLSALRRWSVFTKK